MFHFPPYFQGVFSILTHQLVKLLHRNKFDHYETIRNVDVVVMQTEIFYNLLNSLRTMLGCNVKPVHGELIQHSAKNDLSRKSSLRELWIYIRPPVTNNDLATMIWQSNLRLWTRVFNLCVIHQVFLTAKVLKYTYQTDGNGLMVNVNFNELWFPNLFYRLA